MSSPGLCNYCKKPLFLCGYVVRTLISALEGKETRPRETLFLLALRYLQRSSGSSQLRGLISYYGRTTSRCEGKYRTERYRTRAYCDGNNSIHEVVEKESVLVV